MGTLLKQDGEATGPQTPADHIAVTEQGVFGAVEGHTLRSLAVDPKEGSLYVGVGSMGNIAEEPEVKASIQVFDADGSNQRTFASGMRNPTGIHFPSSKPANCGPSCRSATVWATGWCRTT